MKTAIIAAAAAAALTGCHHFDGMDKPQDAAPQTDALYDADKVELMNKTALPVGAFKSPPHPNYGPEAGSISFTDTDPGPTIGGSLSMKPSATPDANITTYMIHWGLEVGQPGMQDDAGNGDLGGNCMGFRDTGHVVMMPAADAGEMMTWDIPQGTAVPDNAVYFVGHTLYGDIHNLAKCTQTPIINLRN